MYEMVASLLCEIRSDYGTFSVLRPSLGQECGDLGQSKTLASGRGRLCWGSDDLDFPGRRREFRAVGAGAAMAGKKIRRSLSKSTYILDLKY